MAAPKPNETFNELYDRARTLEKHKKQISAKAAINGDKEISSDHSKQPHGASKSSTFKSQKSSTDQAPQITSHKGVKGNQPPSAGFQRRQAYNQPFRGGSFICGGPHLAKVCPDRGVKSEAPGRSYKSRSAEITATPRAVTYTEEELVKMLNECRLKNEETLLAQEKSQCNVISTKEQTGKAVDPTLVIQLQIEDIPVEAMVDTGSQSTVISRAVLHKVGRHLHQQEKEMPQLRLPHCQTLRQRQWRREARARYYSRGIPEI